jgi:peptidoglycan/LPS O-acetylase OafA/YrhL
MYSVVLPALVTTFVLDAAGRALQPDLYPADWQVTNWGFSEHGLAFEFLTGITFTHQLWGLEVRPGSMIAYWSIGYEVWYYAIFGAAIFAPKRWRVAAAAILVLIAGPAIAVLLPLWLLGGLAYRICARGPVPRRLGWALFFGSLLLWVSYEVVALRYGRWVLDPPPLLKRQELPQDYVIGLLFALNIIGFHTLAPTLGAPLRRAAAPIRWAAGATFTLYLFHESLSYFIRALLPWPSSSLATRLVLLFGTLGLVFAIAGVTEKRKDVWKRAIASVGSAGLRRIGWASRGAD